MVAPGGYMANSRDGFDKFGHHEQASADRCHYTVGLQGASEALLDEHEWADLEVTRNVGNILQIQTLSLVWH